VISIFRYSKISRTVILSDSEGTCWRIAENLATKDYKTVYFWAEKVLKRIHVAAARRQVPSLSLRMTEREKNN